MAMITVYHGTTVERAKSILKDKAIKVTSQTTARYDDTTEGYVYVTKELCDALDFSTRPTIKEDTLTFVVFRIQINDKELLPDKDESKWLSTLSDNGAENCFRIKRDLLFENDVISVFCKKMKSHNSAGDYMQAIQYGEKEIKESEWKKLCHD